jgi:opacity protein-like surface antigen
MRKALCGLWLVMSSALVLPSAAPAQTKENAEDFAKDVLAAIFGPNWNLSLEGGTSNHGRLLLQRMPLPGGGTGERVLRGDGGYHYGVGAGVDLLLRMGFRIGYSYSSTDLAFRTDEGNGSTVLDIDDVAKLKSHVVSLQLLRYMLPARAAITPYASVGVVGTWWQLAADSTTVSGDSEFRVGSLASVGLKFKLADRIDMRLEGAWSSVTNPFTGRDSYRVTDGLVVDEPTRVSRSDYRIGLVYHFNKPELKRPDLGAARAQ